MRGSRRSSRAFRKANGPPAGEQFFWFTRPMLESDAWQAMTLPARRVVERVILENMAHGGTQNGDLIVTYDNFAQYGLSSRRITGPAIRIAVALGFLDVVVKGRRSYGGARLASRYGLTWLPRCDGTPASNRWRTLEGANVAAIAREAAAAKRLPRPARTHVDLEVAAA